MSHHIGADLVNDTVVNVATLLKEPFGSSRTYRLHLDAFELWDEAFADEVIGTVKLTRLTDEILVDCRVHGSLELECVRCLRNYEQDFAASFSVEFRQTVDVRTGIDLVLQDEEDDERFLINDSHELDISEPLRQEIVVGLPMKPTCGEDCPGPDIDLDADGPIDDRFSALASLLDDEATDKADS